MVLLNTGNTLPASNQNMDDSNGAKQTESWHKHEPFMMVEKQKNKGELKLLRIKTIYYTIEIGQLVKSLCK